MVLLTTDQLQAASKIRDHLTGWRAIEDLITSVFEEHSQNEDRFIVLLKVRLLNQLYWTRIIAEDQVAQRIAQQNDLLAPLLALGNPKAVQIIAECGIGRKEQVFASKYAHFHEPERFAIGDKYVDIALKALKLQPWSRDRHKISIAEAYQQFRNQIEAIARERQTSLRNVDHYLWLKGQKEAAAIRGVDKLNAEVQWSMRQHPNLWGRL